MEHTKTLSLLTIILLVCASLVAKAQENPLGDKSAGSPGSPNPLSALLPDKLAGLKATGEVREYNQDGLADLVGDELVVYQEYLVLQAASRPYISVRVDIFQTENPYAAFGLFSYNPRATGAKTIIQEIGSGGAWANGSVVFWKGNYFVRVVDERKPSPGVKPSANMRIAQAIAAAIPPGGASDARPPLLGSLPRASAVAQSERYFLGPESLNTYVARGRDMFGFAGDAEAVMAEYDARGDRSSSASTIGPPGRDSSPERAAAPHTMKLIIVEYHTPQFASEAMSRVTSYVGSLPDEEQSRIILEREGNYIVEAVNVEDHDFARQLIDSIEYPYTVKWLRDPLLPTNDPFRQQKAAQMLLSTFGVLGLILLTVLVGGATFGATIFLKRRKSQREVFSDAGGMLLLDIDHFDARLLGLPPPKED